MGRSFACSQRRRKVCGTLDQWPLPPVSAVALPHSHEAAFRPWRRCHPAPTAAPWASPQSPPLPQHTARNQPIAHPVQRPPPVFIASRADAIWFKSGQLVFCAFGLASTASKQKVLSQVKICTIPRADTTGHRRTDSSVTERPTARPASSAPSPRRGVRVMTGPCLRSTSPERATR